MNPELLVLASRAFADIDRYANLTTMFARCGCGCGNTIVELYRVDPTGESGAYLVAHAAGAHVFEAVVGAHADFLHAMEKHNERVAETNELEALFNAPSAEGAQ